MQSLDLLSIVKYMPIPDGRIDNKEVMFLDYYYGNNITNTSIPNEIGIKVYKKNLSEDKINPFSTSKLSDLFNEVLEKYYNLYLRDKADNIPKLEWDIKDDKRKLQSKCYMGSNFIAAESRRGDANVYIIPDERYKYLSSHGGKIILNTTDIHKDKIFVIRVDIDLSAPGLTLFTSRNISDRYLKLVKLMGKMGKGISDMPFNYTLSEIGNEIGKLVQIVYLTDK